jgi:hypothetical protein
MLIEHLTYAMERSRAVLDGPPPPHDAQLALVFRDRAMMEGGDHLDALRKRFPTAALVSYSSRGRHSRQSRLQ